MAMVKPKLGLTLKFILIISLIIIVTSIVLTSFFINSQIVNFRSALQNRGKSLARNLAYNGEYGVLTANKESLSKLTEGLMKEEEVVYCLILDKEGEMLSQSGTFDIAKTPVKPDDALLKELKKGKTVVRPYFSKDGPPVYDIIASIVTRKIERRREEIGLMETGVEKSVEEYIGIARLGISLVRLNQQIAKATNTAILLTCIVILFGIIVAISMIRIILKPISQLALATKMLAAGDLSYRVEIKSNDEIGELADSFNQMTAELKKSKDEIEEYGQTLEEKVEERTRELKEAHIQMLQSAKMAAVGQLGAGVAHELNNPLAGILGYAQFMLEKFQRPEFGINDLKSFQKYIESIERESARSKKIVESLLKFSRKSVSGNPEPVDIRKAIDETVSLIFHQMKLKNVKVTTDISYDLAFVNGIANQLQQIFTNLILNAQQAMPDGGELRITARNIMNEKSLKPERISIEFTDTGCGITEENLSRIFEPFFTTKGKDRGTGLGLSVSYQIIQEHKGSIEVKSEVGKGATFIVYLPAIVD